MPPPRSGAPLPSSDPFAGTTSVVFRQSLDQPFLGSYQVLDDGHNLRGFVLRDGTGLRALLMNYALQDADYRPIYLLRQPAARPGIHIGGAFSLQHPDGTVEGLLDMRAGLRWSTFRLDRPGHEPLAADKHALSWTYDVYEGLRTVARVRIDRLAFPGGIHLEFAPDDTRPPQRPLLVAFVAFVNLWTAVGQFPV